MTLYIIVIAFLLIYCGLAVMIYRLDQRITQVRGECSKLKNAVDEDYRCFDDEIAEINDEIAEIRERLDCLKPTGGFSGDLNSVLNYQPSKMKRMAQKRGGK